MYVIFKNTKYFLFYPVQMTINNFCVCSLYYHPVPDSLIRIYDKFLILNVEHIVSLVLYILQ